MQLWSHFRLAEASAFREVPCSAEIPPAARTPTAQASQTHPSNSFLPPRSSAGKKTEHCSLSSPPGNLWLRNRKTQASFITVCDNSSCFCEHVLLAGTVAVFLNRASWDRFSRGVCEVDVITPTLQVRAELQRNQVTCSKWFQTRSALAATARIWS